MKNRYKCENCKCNLDAGEGSICDECSELLKENSKKIEYIKQTIKPNSYGQFEMEFNI